MSSVNFPNVLKLQKTMAKTTQKVRFPCVPGLSYFAYHLLLQELQTSWSVGLSLKVSKKLELIKHLLFSNHSIAKCFSTKTSILKCFQSQLLLFRDAILDTPTLAELKNKVLKGEIESDSREGQVENRA